MGQSFSYMHEMHWIVEGAPWQTPEVITLRDEAGVAIGSSQMATMLMTIYDVKTDAIVNGVDGTIDVKNARGCTISPAGVFVLKLLSTDTVRLNPNRDPEYRRILVQYTWPLAPTKSDALEITVVIRNVHMRPYVAP